MTDRPSLDEVCLRAAQLWAARGTCGRRRVGCVLVNARGHTLATGYNGPPSGMPHCTEHPCPGRDQPSGVAIDECEATHAEANALLQCHDVYAIDTCYSTASPCVACVKLLMNTSCRRIVFIEEYPNPRAREWWLRPFQYEGPIRKHPRTWEQLHVDL